MLGITFFYNLGLKVAGPLLCTKPQSYPAETGLGLRPEKTGPCGSLPTVALTEAARLFREDLALEIGREEPKSL